MAEPVSHVGLTTCRHHTMFSGQHVDNTTCRIVERIRCVRGARTASWKTLRRRGLASLSLYPAMVTETLMHYPFEPSREGC